MAPQSSTLLRITAAPGYGAPGEALRYRFDDDGAVVSVRGPSGITYRPWPRR